MKGRLEMKRAKHDAWKLVIVKLGRQYVWINERSSNDLEWTSRASTLRDVCSLKHHTAGIDRSGVWRWHIRRRQHPRQTGRIEIHRTPPAFHRDYIEIATDSKLKVEHQGQLADGHSMTHWNWKHTDE